MRVGNFYIGILGMALGLGFGSPARALVSPSGPRVLSGKVVSVTGKAFVRRDGVRTPETVLASEGSLLQVGDVLQTGPRATLKVLLADETIVDLGESSQLQIQGFSRFSPSKRHVVLGLYRGRLRASVTQKLGEGDVFRIRTPATTLALKSSEVLVEAGPEGSQTQTQITVLTGSADVAGLQAPVRLGPGDRFTVRGTGRLQPAVVHMEKLSPGQLEAVTKTLTVLKQDPTFQNAVEFAEVSEGRTRGRSTLQALAATVVPPSESLDVRSLVPESFAVPDPKP